VTVEAGWTFEVDFGSEGERLDVYLSKRIPRLSRARTARLVVVDLDDPGRGPLKKSLIVRAGQRLFARRPVPDAGVVPPTPTVLYEDARLLVIDKPAGLAAHPTATRFVATVKHWLKTEGYDDGHEPIHRLDVETSGVMAIARTPTMARWAKMALAEGRFEKTYLAVVEGAPAWTQRICEVPLGPASESEVRLKIGEGHLPSRTDFTALSVCGDRALVRAEPVTGRQHQIRVHLAMLGHPIVGDKLYGPDEALFLASLQRPLTDEERAQLGADRHALHAARLVVPTPDGGALTVEAPWPEDLRALHPGPG
jgi:23S rRNA pseudouridine1911/1915/1917 synthase